jgi:cation:H+ antiporter
MLQKRKEAFCEREDTKLLVNSVLLILGFALLIKGSDIFVDASVGIAEKLKVPKVIIGLTIVAMGTGAPELVISVTASMRGSNALAVGNIVGSNIFNLMFIIGLCAMVAPMAVKVKDVHKEFWLSIVAAIFLLVLKIFGDGFISQVGSFFMVVIFAAYMFFLIRKARADTSSSAATNKKFRKIPVYAFLAIFGLALIIGGGHITVNSATYIADWLGISQRLIAITVVAIGTSLPELVISLMACKKGENEFALGNIIGSNIFNILFILGVAGLISPLEIDDGLMSDTVFLVAGSIIALIFVYTKKRISFPEGLIMVGLFLVYMGVAVYTTIVQGAA